MVFFSVAGVYTDAVYRQLHNVPMRTDFFAQTQDLPALYHSAKSITFIVDAVVFADGKFAGPDKSHRFERYSDMIAAALDLSKATLSFRGQAVDDLKQYLAAISRLPNSSLLDLSKATLSFRGQAVDDPNQYLAAISRLPKSSRYTSFLKAQASLTESVLQGKGPDAVFFMAQQAERQASFPLHR